MLQCYSNLQKGYSMLYNAMTAMRMPSEVARSVDCVSVIVPLFSSAVSASTLGFFCLTGARASGPGRASAAWPPPGVCIFSYLVYISICVCTDTFGCILCMCLYLFRMHFGIFSYAFLNLYSFRNLIVIMNCYKSA